MINLAHSLTPPHLKKFVYLRATRGAANGITTWHGGSAEAELAVGATRAPVKIAAAANIHVYMYSIIFSAIMKKLRHKSFGNGKMDLLVERNFKRLNEFNEFDRIYLKMIRFFWSKINKLQLRKFEPIMSM